MIRLRRMGWRGRLLFGVVALLLLLAVAGVGFAWWASQAAAPMPEALAALESSDAVTVSTGDWFVFTPTATTPSTGFIFYPGGRVDPRAYAPPLHEIAAAGYLVVMPPMPLNLAVFGADQAATIMAAYPVIDQWYIGGHSLGGAMAANFVANQPAEISGLVLWAAYPAEGASLAARTALTVTSIYGSEDGLATPAKIDTARAYLPASTTYVEIEGGNHAQFGWYGTQSGDNPATISREVQQEQLVDATLAALQE